MTRPQRVNDSFGVLIPTLATGMKDAKLHQLLDEVLELSVFAFLDVDRLDAIANARQHGVHAVRHLTLDHPHDRVMTQTHVGTQQIKQIRETGTGDAEIRVGNGTPDVGQIPAVFATHRHVLTTGHEVESGGVNDGVAFDKLLYLVSFLVGFLYNYAVGDDAVDLLSHQSGVGRVEALDVIVGNGDSLTPHIEIGNQFLLQLWFLDHTLHVMSDLTADSFAHSRSFAENGEKPNFLPNENVPTM